MQFDEFDKKAKDAADHHHPAYHEQAWVKMEKLLNKHLPQNEDNRRRFLFLWLLLLGLGGAGLFIARPWKEKKTIVATEQTVQQKPGVKQPTDTKQNTEATINNNTVAEKKSNASSITTIDTKPDSDFSTPEQSVYLAQNSNKQKNKKAPVSASPLTKTKNILPAVNTDNKGWQQNAEAKNKPADNKTTVPVTANKQNQLTDIVNTDKKQGELVAVNSPAVISIDKQATIEPAMSTGEKKENESIAENEKKKEKSKPAKSNSFFFTISTGADVSFAGKDKLGTTKLLAGAGIGFTFKNRFTIRTGFYSGRKVYTASPDAYHPPTEFYIYYPYLEKVEADCKVYEIPLSISYNFSSSTKHNWFATTGLSSYLMKEETYNYYYKYNPSGPVYNRKRTFNNENKHYFSTLTLSGGYQRSITKNISMMVEPYVKLPLTGVGYGKVKLNSGGVLFSIGIKPFSEKKSNR